MWMGSFCLWVCRKFYSMVTQLSSQCSWLSPSPSNPAPKGLLLTFQTAEQLSNSCYWNLNKNKIVFFPFPPKGGVRWKWSQFLVCANCPSAASPVLGWSALICFKDRLRAGVALRKDKQEVLRAGDVSPMYRGTAWHCGSVAQDEEQSFVTPLPWSWTFQLYLSICRETILSVSRV